MGFEDKHNEQYYAPEPPQQAHFNYPPGLQQQRQSQLQPQLQPQMVSGQQEPERLRGGGCCCGCFAGCAAAIFCCPCIC
ncbi:hypothetical protein BDV93DRAFT_518297 [Ceratobasidium sp. AG-I]|nr:hypothetical protein BDV93DRAFT_518297 [Ceratobasidium sp. AG-I]